RRHTRSKRDWSSDVCSSDLGRFRITIRYYLLAAAMLPAGAVFGVLLARGLSGTWHGRLLVAHTMVNLLGWVGLTILGTLLTLWPAEEWSAYYGSEHSGTWTYGMPELPLADGTRQREQLRGAREIAVPGCNATAVTLALAPLVRAGVVDAAHLSAVLPVGYSGAGRAAKQHLMFSEAHG